MFAASEGDVISLLSLSACLCCSSCIVYMTVLLCLPSLDLRCECALSQSERVFLIIHASMFTSFTVAVGALMSQTVCDVEKG